MLFNSWTFLFGFLPVVLAVHHLLDWRFSARAALGWLTLASFGFYAYWNPPYLLLLLGSIGINHRIGVQLRQSEGRPAARHWLVAGIALNLSLIGWFKYAGFFAGTLEALTRAGLPPLDIVLPLGISFFTFQQISWLVDVRRGSAPVYSLPDYARYVAFFPQLIAGPIVQHHEMMPQFDRAPAERKRMHDLAVGLAILSIGLFKKVVLADSIAPFATPVFDAADAGITISLAEAWTGALAWTLQLYFDFSGYSDMAIGLARLFGITLPVNFDSPYRATSIIEFWRRWHMTLSRFLRDYLYIPMGGNRHGAGRKHLYLMITMLLGGLWHGAGWNFVLWGGLHGLYLLINHAWRARRTAAASWFASRAGQALTLLAVIVAWVPFRATTLEGAAAMLATMAGLNGVAVPAAAAIIADPFNALIGVDWLQATGPYPQRLFEPLPALLWLSAAGAIALFMPNTQQIMRKARPVLEAIGPTAPDGLLASVRDRWSLRQLTWRPSPGWSIATGLLALAALLHLSSVSEFLYFQF